MNSMKKIITNLFMFNEWKDWFKDGFEDLSYNILGNFLPFWASLVVYFIDSGLNWQTFYNAFHQPYTFLILSGTYLTSAFYLQSKPKMENRILKFLYFPFIIIIGLFVSKKSMLENLSAPFHIELTVVLLFLICFVVYTILLFRSHYIRLSMKASDYSKAEKENLEEDFDKTNEK